VGATGAAGVRGVSGPDATTGYAGLQGAQGTAGFVLAAADIYAMMDEFNPDNAVVAVGDAIQFPHPGTIVGTGITYLASDGVTLVAGVYSVSFVVSVKEQAQLALTLDGVITYRTVSGRSSGTTQVSGFAAIRTTNASSTLKLVNVSNIPITITPNAGGQLPVSAHLLVTRVA
jgi:hypothetical protein